VCIYAHAHLRAYVYTHAICSPGPKVYDLGDAPAPGQPWRCIECYNTRFKTMNFGMNQGRTIQYIICGRERETKRDSVCVCVCVYVCDILIIAHTQTTACVSMQDPLMTRVRRASARRRRLPGACGCTTMVCVSVCV
jgi:hypothetical protein